MLLGSISACQLTRTAPIHSPKGNQAKMPRCDVLQTTSVGLNDITPLGFSAAQAMRLFSPQQNNARYRDDTSTKITIEVAYRGDLISYVETAPNYQGVGHYVEILCEGHLSIPLTMTAWTDDHSLRIEKTIVVQIDDADYVDAQVALDQSEISSLIANSMLNEPATSLVTYEFFNSWGRHQLTGAIIAYAEEKNIESVSINAVSLLAW